MRTKLVNTHALHGLKIFRGQEPYMASVDGSTKSAHFHSSSQSQTFCRSSQRCSWLPHDICTCYRGCVLLLKCTLHGLGPTTMDSKSGSGKGSLSSNSNPLRRTLQIDLICTDTLALPMSTWQPHHHLPATGEG